MMPSDSDVFGLREDDRKRLMTISDYAASLLKQMKVPIESMLKDNSRKDQLEAFAKYRIIPSLFTDHTFFFGDTHVANRGLAQASFISPMKSALAAGLKPTNHTDAFVTPIDQMMTVWTAVTRKLRSGGVLGPDERISPYQALQAITTSAAYQYREEASKGSIKAGKRADLVVLSADPTKVEPDDIRNIKVLETIKDGTTIYTAGQ